MPVTRALAAALLAAAACGGAPKPAPAPAPAPIDTKRIAADLHAEMNEMAAITARTSGQCAAMTAALRALFERMRRSVSEVHKAELDAAVAKQLTADMHAYDAADAGLSDAIHAGLVTCKDDAELQRAMAAMPEL